MEKSLASLKLSFSGSPTKLDEVGPRQLKHRVKIFQRAWSIFPSGSEYCPLAIELTENCDVVETLSQAR